MTMMLSKNGHSPCVTESTQEMDLPEENMLHLPTRHAAGSQLTGHTSLEVHQEQDLERSGRAHSPRAGISGEPKWTGSVESLQGDLPGSKGQSGQAALEKAKLCLGKARLEINETQQGYLGPSRFVP